LSIATEIWEREIMCIIIKERITFGAQVEGTQGEVFAASPIAVQSQCKRVPNEPIPTYGHSWPSTPECSSKEETDKVRRNGETAMGRQYATRHVVLMPGAE